MPSESPATAQPSTIGNEVLNLRHVFRAPPPRVFAAFTDPKVVAQWFGPKQTHVDVLELDLRIGGRYRFDMHLANGDIVELAGTYVEISPPERLVFTWGWVGGVTQDTEVSLEFRPHDSGTELLLTHRRLPSPEQRDYHSVGWCGSFECLEDLLQGGN
ncbi:MAG: SRPBCC family protein [Alphaproteobacteria bacterium]